MEKKQQVQIAPGYATDFDKLFTKLIILYDNQITVWLDDPEDRKTQMQEIKDTIQRLMGYSDRIAQDYQQDIITESEFLRYNSAYEAIADFEESLKQQIKVSQNID